MSNTEAVETTGKIEIAAYDMCHFPETQDESTEIGHQLVAKQIVAVKSLIAAAFQDVFHKNWEERFTIQCERMQIDGKDVLFYRNRPFLELGEMEEEFKMRNGAQHLVFTQSYQVL